METTLQFILTLIGIFAAMKVLRVAPFALQVDVSEKMNVVREDLPQEKLEELQQAKDDELDKLIEKGLPENQDDPKKTPDGPVETDTPKDTAEADDGKPKTEPPAGEEKKAEAGKPAAGDDKLLAGKYKTTEELKTATTNIAAKLGGLNATVVNGLIKIAEKTGDWSELEAVYKNLESELGKAKPAAQQGKTPGEKPEDAAAAPKADQERLQELRSAVLTETVARVKVHPLATRMRQRGVEIPTGFLTDKAVTNEFMQTLEEDYPVYYVEMRAAIEKIYNETTKEAVEIVKAEDGLEEHNKTQVSAQQEKIINYAKQMGVELKAEDLQNEIAGIMAEDNALLYEDRYGVQYLRDGGLFNAWLLKNYDNLLKQVSINKQLEGRTQHRDDLDKMRKTPSISTAHTPSGKQRSADAPKIDPADDRDLAAISDAQLDEAITKGLKK